MIALAQGLIAWLNVFVTAGGAVVSAINVKRSRWAFALLGGFAAETAVLAFFRVAAFLSRQSVFGPSMLTAAYLVASVVGVAARIAVVVGVAGVLSELPAPSPVLASALGISERQ